MNYRVIPSLPLYGLILYSCVSRITNLHKYCLLQEDSVRSVMDFLLQSEQHWAPHRQIICISGDGSFQMNLQELMTAMYYQLPVKIAILNNGYLGMVRQWQEMFFHRRYSSVRLTSPDYVMFAQSYGATGLRAQTIQEAREIIGIALSTPTCYHGI